MIKDVVVHSALPGIATETFVCIVGNLDTIGSIAASQLDFALFQILYLATAEGAQGDESAPNRINKLRVINVDHWYESLSLRH